MGLRTSFLIAHAIFFVSGASGLGYQVIWARWFGLGLGQELTAVFASVGAYFGGFALGAAGLDRAIRQSGKPGSWYAGLEAVVGCWAVLAMVLIPGANELARRLTGIEPHPWWQAAVAFGLPFVVLLPASASMGATFPAMERFARGLSADGQVIGSLYATHTAGAALGTMACAFWLVPVWGFTATTLLFGLFSLACAAAILLVGSGSKDALGGPTVTPALSHPMGEGVGRSLTPTLSHPMGEGDRGAGAGALRPTEQARKGPFVSGEPVGGRAGCPQPAALIPPGGISRGRLRVLLLMSGLLGIGLEVLGVRVLKLALENTVLTFACILTVYLAGTALGAALVKRFLGHVSPARRLNGLLGGLALACALGGFALAASPDLNGWLRRTVGASAAGGVLVESLVAASVFLVPTVLMGATFTTLADLVRERYGSMGRALAWNTLGGALAPWLVGWLLFPSLGAKWTLLILIAGYLAMRPQGGHRPTLVVAGLALSAGFLLPDLRLVSLQAGERLVALREGVSDTVAVIETAAGHRALRVNNRFTMGGTASVVAERRQAHLPLLLHPQPKRALFLGSGTGITAAAATAHPGLQVDSVELVSDIVALQSAFAPENTGDPHQLRPYVADARRFVQVTSERYDVIVADLFHPARDGAGGLYTWEHYRAVGGCLTAGGLFCQWIPLYQFDLSAVGLVVGSMRQAFPRVYGFLLRATVDTPVLGLVGSAVALRLGELNVEGRAQDPGLSQALRETGLTDVVQLLGWELFDAEDLREFVRPDSDDRLMVNFRMAWRLPTSARPPYATLFELMGRVRAGTEGSLRAPGLEPGVAARVRRFAEARDAYLFGLGWEVEGESGQALGAFIKSAGLSEDFTTGYAHAVTLAVQMAPDQPATARRVLEQLVEARPEQPVALELLGRLFPDGDR